MNMTSVLTAWLRPIQEYHCPVAVASTSIIFGGLTYIVKQTSW
jgi:hypothetical protein